MSLSSAVLWGVEQLPKPWFSYQTLQTFSIPCIVTVGTTLGDARKAIIVAYLVFFKAFVAVNTVCFTASCKGITRIALG